MIRSLTNHIGTHLVIVIYNSPKKCEYKKYFCFKKCTRCCVECSKNRELFTSCFSLKAVHEPLYYLWQAMWCLTSLYITCLVFGLLSLPLKSLIARMNLTIIMMVIVSSGTFWCPRPELVLAVGVRPSVGGVRLLRIRLRWRFRHPAMSFWPR